MCPKLCPHLPKCYSRPPALMDSLLFGQEEADAAEGDAGGLWRRYLPGDCHHSHGDAQNPAAGCRTHWYVDFSSLSFPFLFSSEQEGEKELGLGFQGGAERMSAENPFPPPALPRQRYRRCSRSFSSSSQLTSPHMLLSWLCCRGPCSYRRWWVFFSKQ